ncbi:recombinase RecA [uncultured Ruminococcus sp.]|uniref:recombinase RecA n=1 Tax=uncultured Ruminococcus sp. TaxID=165186 RepID=UPI0026317B63|nr:recombinase RecA [uncultured Ruminococcus sp.]
MAKADLKKKVVINMPETEEEKKKALQSAIAHITKTYGTGAIMRLGENKTNLNVEAIPTGSMMLDLALGIGGVPRGRIVELYGPESSGKTTVALHIIAEAQKLGGEVAFIDVEHALDPLYAEALGVNIDNLLVSQPDSGEQALEIAEALVRSGAIDVLVVDSVAALTTKAEIDGEMGDSHVGQLARLMSQAMRKLTAVISKSHCVAIFINQVREKIGTMYGNPETTPGGRALKFYASVRMEVRRGEPIKEGANQIGNRTKVKISKNKVAPPFRECEFDILYGKGISRTGEVVDVATELGVIKKGGSWYSYGDQKLGQGRENVKKLFEENPELMKEIEGKIMEQKEALAEAAKKKKKKSKLEEAAAKAAEADGDFDGTAEDGAPETEGAFETVDTSENLEVSAEDDFEEFDPT